ncbi:MAG: DNA-processing protein DprA [Steroidobacteraceae bacterium]
MLVCDDALAWVTLTRAPALTAATVLAALERLESAVGIVAASEAIHRGVGIPAAARDFLRQAGGGPDAAERKWLQHERHHLLPFTDPRYPTLLRSLADCPIALYVAGNVNALSEPQLAVVGSRNPTLQGRDTAFDFAHRLARRGLAITSGLAQGIDAAAHRGALAAQGITVAVLGNGIDQVYPRDHRHLSGTIEQHGALISEFPLGTAPRAVNFPRRNRIIAGMTLGTLVVEAASRSGSRITARAANDCGREVFAVPGSIHNPSSRGCHELIKQGAKLTETPDDILSELNFSTFFTGGSHAADAGSERNSGASGMDKEHKILLDALGFDPADIDMLVVRTGFKPEAVSSMMLILELEGHVQAAPGGRYSRVANRSRS